MSPQTAETEGRRYLDALDSGAGSMVRSHPKLGVIAVYPDECGQWWVQAAHTRVPAVDQRGAESIADKWDRTGDCPVPKRFRVTPRTQTRSA